jgi:membrane glycosyltransferase
MESRLWALALVAVTLFLLFLPKLLALLELTLSGRLAQHGGAGRLGISVLIEILVSALLAPIRMLAHTRHVLEAVFNTTLRWAGQNRSDETQWRDAFASETPGTLLALSWAGFAWWLDPAFFLWTLPVVLPLVLATPTAVLFGRVRPGQWLRQRGLLLVPAERHVGMSPKTCAATRGFWARAAGHGIHPGGSGSGGQPGSAGLRTQGQRWGPRPAHR